MSEDNMNAMVMTQQAEGFMPLMSIDESVKRFGVLVDFVKRVMREGADYGKIPGSDKPTLLKPGAEKLCTLFGLTKHFEEVRSIEDWEGDKFNGEAFFSYTYRCQLKRGDMVIAESDGSCNSRESKYRWRKAERTCPQCGAAAIIKGKAEYGGGWLCWKKKGGCDAKFSAGDVRIESQEVGRIPNPDIADTVNTIQKMAQKRAFIAAALLAVNASEFFTQDMEDLDYDAEKHAPPPANGSHKPKPTQGVVMASQSQTDRIKSLLAQLGNAGKDVADQFRKHSGPNLATYTADQAADFIHALEARADELDNTTPAQAAESAAAELATY